MNTPAGSSRPVLIWLLVVYLLILVMVVIGGVTRLTGSGLSMVEWRPLMGAVPPLGEAHWNAVFEQYQQTPQYALVNQWMTLGDFKRIFFWEYLHRLFGRLIGVAFFVPWLYFTLRRRLRGRLALQTLGLFVLGGLQGVMGWYMVQSGLVDRPSVSHLRLAAHLGLAFLIAQAILWVILGQRERRPPEAARRALRVGAWAILSLVALQIVWGAFMAGTRAGYLFATFPDLNGQWVPSTLLEAESIANAVVNDLGSIHFVHRTLGYVVFVVVLAYWAIGRRWAAEPLRLRPLNVLLALTLLQVVLGVVTVTRGLPLWLAATHQAGAFLLLSSALWCCFRMGAEPTRGSMDS